MIATIAYYGIVVDSKVLYRSVKNIIFLYTKISEVNLFPFVYRLFHEDFSSIVKTFLLNHLHAYIL